VGSRERLVDVDPKQRQRILSDLIKRIDALHAGPFDLIASADTSSLFLGSLLAEALQLPMAYVRPKPKGHGRQKQVEGKIGEGDRTLIVADTETAAEPVARAVEVVDTLGGRVAGCLVVMPGDRVELAAYFGDRPELVWDLISALAEQQRADDAPAPIALIGRGGDPKSARSTLSGQERVALALLDVGAVAINRREPFTYASGLLSPIYTDCRLLLTNPDQWGAVIDGFVELLRSEVSLESFDLLSGVATSGIPHAALVAGRLDLPMAYLTFPEGGPASGIVEGSIEAGDRVVMIEDLPTTGQSVLKSVAAIRDRGAIVEWCLGIFSYGSPVAAKNFNDEQVQLRTLCDIKTLLSVAKDHGRIEAADEAAVLDWLDAPSTWADRQKGSGASSSVAPG